LWKKRLDLNKDILNDWKRILDREYSKEYFQGLEAFLDKEYATNTVFPLSEDIFNAFRLTPYSQVKVVILGQDPYHDDLQAHGLSFSVQKGVKFPPSLRNIFKELKDDCKLDIPTHGNLEHWSKQGVLLLNTVLTVRAHEAASHSKKKDGKFLPTKLLESLTNEKNRLFLYFGVIMLVAKKS
jgi:uracil-DNA glycosylase